MAAGFDMQNVYEKAVAVLQLALTARGVEFEFEWYEAAVPATTGRVFLRVTTPADKYTLVTFREIRHNQTRGFYRQYAEADFSGGVLDRAITPVNLRGDSPVGSGATFEVLTGVTADPADAFSEIPLWGQAGPGNQVGQGSGLNNSQAFRLIPPAVVVLLEFANTSANPADWYAYFKQFEVSPDAICPAEGV
jgi:hypothetical protein